MVLQLRMPAGLGAGERGKEKTTVKKAPCAGENMELCKDRYPGCHDHCERFKAWKEERNKEFLYNYEQTKMPPISDASRKRYWENLKRRNDGASNKRRKKRI